jgi:hypothetical protein
MTAHAKVAMVLTKTHKAAQTQEVHGHGGYVESLLIACTRRYNVFQVENS